MSLENITNEDYDDAHYLSNQVEQAKRRAVLAASDADSARSDAWNAAHAAGGHSKVSAQIVGMVERARDEAVAAADRAEAPTDSMVASLASNPLSLTRVAVDQATSDMINKEGSQTQLAGDASWLTKEGTDIAVSAEIERTGSEVQISGDARWVTNSQLEQNMGGLISQGGSQVRDALDTRYATLEMMNAAHPSRASVAWGTYMGCPYSVVRVFDATRPGVIGKTFANGFEAEHKTGSALIPGFETIRQAQARTGWPVIANADGWRTTGNIGELRGVQIIDGKVFHEFEDPANTAAQQGLEAVGIMADGSYRAYSALDGDTAAGMIADGVITSFCFGPRIVIEGTERDLSGSFWTSYQTTKTAHQIIGYSADGTFVIVSLTGISGSTGITGIEAATLAVQEGLHDAWIMDRGGSTQTMVNGHYVMPSSDQNCERAIPAFLVANAIVGTGDLASPWWPCEILAPTVMTHETAPSWRISGDLFEFTGGVQMADASMIPNAVNYALKIPFKPARQTVTLVPSVGTVTGKVALRTDGQMNLNGNGTTTTYLKLDPIIGKFLP